jgi:hypothetical protein
METPPSPETAGAIIGKSIDVVRSLLFLYLRLVLVMTEDYLWTICCFGVMLVVVVSAGSRMEKRCRVMKLIASNKASLWDQFKAVWWKFVDGILSLVLVVLHIVRAVALLIWAFLAVIVFALTGGFNNAYPELKEDGSEDAIDHWLWRWIIEQVLFIKREPAATTAQAGVGMEARQDLDPGTVRRVRARAGGPEFTRRGLGSMPLPGSLPPRIGSEATPYVLPGMRELRRAAPVPSASDGGSDSDATSASTPGSSRLNKRKYNPVEMQAAVRREVRAALQNVARVDATGGHP